MGSYFWGLICLSQYHMAKVRVELVMDFGARKGQVLSGIAVEPNYDALLKAVQNKCQLKKKDVVTLCCHDFMGLRVLPRGDLSDVVQNDAKIIVCKDAPAASSQSGAEASQVINKDSEITFSKKAQKAAEQLQLVRAGNGCLSARGRPNLESLAALQHLKGVTGVVTLLRLDECVGATGKIGQVCERLGLKWCSAPLAGPKEMGMTGPGMARLTEGDIESFRKVQEVKAWLESSDEKIVVHCAAGLHRTGIFLYVLLRVLGEDPEQALDKIRHAARDV